MPQLHRVQSMPEYIVNIPDSVWGSSVLFFLNQNL